MRPFVAALAALFALSLPLLAQAGGDCPYSKQDVTTASHDASTASDAKGDEVHACSASCPHAAAHAHAKGASARGCACAAKAAAELQATGDDAQSNLPAEAVAATD